jgi:phenylphosphate carboxylase alpha subunit
VTACFSDLREFLDRLEAEREVARIADEVDWNLELGALSRIGLDRRSPALWFDKIKDHNGGMSVLANLIGPTKPVIQGRMALAMGLPKQTPTMELIDEFARRNTKLIPPVIVETGACKQHIMKGDDIDLWRFPVPLIHGMDGGRFLGTWHIDVTKDPDNGHVNWGMYRHEVHDKNTLGWLAIPAQHGPSLYYQKYSARNEPMPLAIAIGTEPITSIVAGTSVPATVSEPELAGGIRGQAVELVKCETVDLEVPAHAEIVIEGYVHPSGRRDEGVFGEFTGYAAGERAPRPFMNVTCVTHRHNPILTVSNMGKPWDDFGVMSSITMSAMIGDSLRQQGIPFKSVYVPAPVLAVIVSVKAPYHGFAQTLASAIWSSKAGIYRPYIFVVGEDVDVTNAEDVFWCLTTRLHPVRGIHQQHDTNLTPLWPFLSHEERLQGSGSKVMFDATFPANWPEADGSTIIDLEHAWPSEVGRAALDRWAGLGLD